MSGFHIGVDENGLGARLGPLVVTAVLAETDEQGERMLARRLPAKLRADLDDSKRLVSHTNVTLGEAWARLLTAEKATHPAELFELISLEGSRELQRPCPSSARSQCWPAQKGTFESGTEELGRVRRHVQLLEKRGIRLLTVRSSVVCTDRLNHLRSQGINRFVADLHAMERLILSLREQADAPVQAICGKVGGIGEYGKYFGPLASRLFAIVNESHAESEYQFPKLGRVRFVRDADASAPLVMLASLVGKYVRELFMGRIASHWNEAGQPPPSGYHDPVTSGFVTRSALIRQDRELPDGCFERERDLEAARARAALPAKKAKKPKTEAPAPPKAKARAKRSPSARKRAEPA